MASATFTTTLLPRFRALVEEWTAKHPSSAGFTVPLSDLRSTTSATANKDVVVAFRTRPPLPNEAAEQFQAAAEGHSYEANSEERQRRAGEEVAKTQLEPVEFCAGITVTSAEPGVFTAHVPGMKWNGPTLAHKSYEADLAFGPDVQNEEVYKRTVVANDLLTLVLSGGVGCILAYGQTGTGKTYTMESVERSIARDLFDQARIVGQRFVAAQGGEHPTGDIFEFQVSFLELLGNHAGDLLEETEEVDVQGNRVLSEVAVREDKVGNVRPNVTYSSVRSSEELESLINKALSHRRSSATQRNAKSSRSHALLSISIKNTLLPYADEGQLVLVDLAGSERYEDSKDHDKQRRDEAKENNKSLMNLKECVRAKAKMAAEDGFVHIPWRSNKLTMLLKPIFDIESRQLSKAVIIAHVSPHIQDTTHSTNTLSYAAPFKTVPPKPRGAPRFDKEDPRTWDHQKTIDWLAEQFDQGTVDPLKICPVGSTAKNLGMLYTPEFVERCLAARHAESCSAEDLKMKAVHVIGNLFYLILTAKTRKRNEVMKSRRRLVMEDTYGVAPRKDHDEDYNSEEFLEAQIYYGMSHALIRFVSIELLAQALVGKTLLLLPMKNRRRRGQTGIMWSTLTQSRT
ncbi:unnamed protein product [Mycena citricolor]|uniref:Kinesin-like protein n=1 Tax=Mycena citricolor TaxID=2018698 RepID=A0AAD2HSQ1_9AGAR|nr:unnamed protein product [Mycena citricolor]